MSVNKRLEKGIGISLCMLSLSLGLICFYYLHQFYKLKDQVIIIKRRGNIVIAYTICAVIILLFGYPLNTLLYWGLLVNDTQSQSYKVLTVIEDLLITPLYYYVSFLCLVRFWMVYYDIHFSNSCLNLEWKQCISSDMVELKKDKWYVSHRTTIGNSSYMVKRTLIICSFFVALSLTLIYLLEFEVIQIKIYHAVNAIVFGILILGLIIIPRKIPTTFSDHINLCKEMKVMSIWLKIALLVYALAVIIELILGRVPMTAVLIQLCGMLALFVAVICSTSWVLKIAVPKPASFNYDMNVKEILKDDKLFDGFMQHLIKEFCMENLLGLIEFVQFKKKVIEVYNINDEQVVNHETNEYEFPASVPLSDIVYGHSEEKMEIDTIQRADTIEDSEVKFKIMARDLYKKYLRSNSEFELNLSSKVRTRMDGLIGIYDEWIVRDYDELQMAKVFDSCILELTALLRGSKDRFDFEI